MKFTRKAYLELYRGSRYVSRHTSIVECAEKASEDAVANPSTDRSDYLYQVRVDGGLYYTIDMSMLFSMGSVPDFQQQPGTPQPNPEHYQDILDEIEGYGALDGEINGVTDVITGGKDKPLIEVTNLNNSGPGSFRQANADSAVSNGAWIHFSQDLTGVVNLTSSITLNPNLTIDGRSADITFQGIGGGGEGGENNLTLDANSRNIAMLYIKTLDAPGDNISTTFGGGALWCYHCDIGPAGDGSIDARNGAQPINYSHCLFHDATLLMLFSNAADAAPGTRASLNNNYFKSNSQRQPNFADASGTEVNNGHLHMWNNLIEDFAFAAHAVIDDAEGWFQGNIYRPTTNFITVDHTQTGRTDGRVKITDEQGNGASPQGGENQPETVFQPTYDYAYRNDWAQLETDIKANAGWQVKPTLKPMLVGRFVHSHAINRQLAQ
jgi:pectate lyase